MWQYQFNQRDAQRILGKEWELGTVRVSQEADRCRDGSFDFIEQLLLRHLYFETGELQADAATNAAIEHAHGREMGYVTLFNYCGYVFKVKTHAGHSITDVTVADDDCFSRQKLPLSFEDVLGEQAADEDEEDEEDA